MGKSLAHKVVLERVGDGFGAAGHVEFGEDVAHMELHRGPADHQLFGNVRVVEALDHEAQHLALAFGQIVPRFVHGVARGGVDERLGRLGRQRRPAGVGRADGVGQFRGGDVFEQIPDGARLERALRDLRQLNLEIEHFYRRVPPSDELIGLRNAARAAIIVADAAWQNKQSVGCHYRED